MPRREDRPAIRIDEDAKLELTRLAQSSEMKETTIASHAIMQVEPMGMLKPDWEDCIKELKEIRTAKNRYDFLDNPCEALGWIKDHYECTWGRVGKTPITKKIGVSEMSVLTRCNNCKNTIDLNARAMNLEKRWTQLISTPLEEYTYCSDGGEYDNNSGRIYCPHLKAWQAQDKCFTILQGGRCLCLKTLPKRPTRQTGMTRRRRR